MNSSSNKLYTTVITILAHGAEWFKVCVDKFMPSFTLAPASGVLYSIGDDEEDEFADLEETDVAEEKDAADDDDDTDYSDDL